MNMRAMILWRPRAALRGVVFIASVGLMLLLGYVHYLSGADYDFRALFVLPVLVASWFLGFRAGLAIALLSAATWLLAHLMIDDSEGSWSSLAFNSTTRLAVFVGEAWILEQLRRLLDRELRLAREDALTGLTNRRELLEQGRRALALAGRQATPFTAVFIDLDKFKEVNDEFGHKVGDELLIEVANGLRDAVRASDIAGRLGGDEFALLLAGMDGAAAQVYVDELRRNLLERMRAHHWVVTFSIGVVSYSQTPDDLERVLAEADRLMYQAKESGRDRIVRKDMP